MNAPRVLIVGGGLTACTLAHRLAQEDVASTVLERLDVPGGLIRSEHMGSVLYEPHGSHIFHTEDEEVWELANAMTPFNAYRHRVDIVADGQLLMGPILYERFIRPYTEKQWGRPAAELAATWAPRRVTVRWNDDPYLFGDPFQGWPSGPTCSPARWTSSPAAASACWSGAGSTCATSWSRTASTRRGRRSSTTPAPSSRSSASTRPSTPRGSSARDRAGLRVHGRAEPVLPHRAGVQLRAQPRHQDHIRAQVGPERTFFAGRLANYVYIDMDDCMRQALDAAEEVLAAVAAPASGGRPAVG